MKSNCGEGIGVPRGGHTLDCGTDCDNCGKHYYGGDFFLCEQCEKAELSEACQEKIRVYVRKYGNPSARYPITKSALRIIKAMK